MTWVKVVPVELASTLCEILIYIIPGYPGQWAG